MPKEVIGNWNQSVAVRWDNKNKDGIQLEIVHDEPFVFEGDLKKGKVKKKTPRYSSLVIRLDDEELDALIAHLKRGRKKAY